MADSPTKHAPAKGGIHAITITCLDSRLPVCPRIGNLLLSPQSDYHPLWLTAKHLNIMIIWCQPQRADTANISFSDRLLRGNDKKNTFQQVLCRSTSEKIRPVIKVGQHRSRIFPIELSSAQDDCRASTTAYIPDSEKSAVLSP